MNRLTATIKGCASVALALAIVGCGGGGTKVDLGKPQDMATNVDLAMPEPDMAITGVGTGQPCKTKDDCAPALNGKTPSRTCLTSSPGPSMTTVTWGMGYCSATKCNTTKNKPEGNPDCMENQDPAGGFSTASCVDLARIGLTAAQCIQDCEETKDCRTGYFCAYFGNFGAKGADDNAAGCFALGWGPCDARKARVCPGKHAAVDGGVPIQDVCMWLGPSVDRGLCNSGCNPFVDRNMNGCSDASYPDCALNVFTDGTEGFCNSVSMKKPGEACTGFYDCPNGYGCSLKQFGGDDKCHKWCNKTNAATQCGMNGRCLPVDKASASGAGVCNQ